MGQGVCEAQAVARAVGQQLVVQRRPNQVAHAGRPVTRELGEQADRQLPPQHRRRAQDLPGLFRHPVETAPDDVTHLAREGELGDGAEPGELEDEQGVALRAALERRQHGVGGWVAGDLPDQLGDGRRRESTEGEPARRPLVEQRRQQPASSGRG